MTDDRPGFGEARAAKALEAMAFGIVVLDAQGKVAVWNKAVETLTGIPASEVLDKDPGPFLRFEPPARLPQPMPQDPQGTAPDEHKCLLFPRHGDPIPVFRQTRLLAESDGQVTGWVHSIGDLRLCSEAAQGDDRVRIVATPMGLGRLVGQGHRMQEVYGRIHQAAASDATVLIHGETGTGKELVAEAIHFTSARKDYPLVRINCSALSEGLLESELFGHVKGAFTGAIRDRMGRFEAAHKGTIFLDEIGDISPLIQVKLLRVLQERRFEPVGSSETREVDVRVIAATHRDLRQRVREGTFREDLYYRLRVFAIEVPALRERKEDIPLLVQAFIDRFNRQTGKSIRDLSQEATLCLMDYCWPGNVRELENAMEHAFVTCQASQIGLFDLPVEIRRTELRSAECAPESRVGRAEDAAPEPVTKDYLLEVLRTTGWNKAEAARRLGINRATVWRKMREWDIPLTRP
jgi:two-component system response regulator HydG